MSPGWAGVPAPARRSRAFEISGFRLSPGIRCGRPEAKELSKRWTARDREAVKQVDKQLASMGLNMDAPMAHAFAFRIDQFERIERLIMNAEARRNAALREVDRHRSNLPKLCAKRATMSSRQNSKTSRRNSALKRMKHEQRS
jgi:hypothetical protein